MDLVLNQGVEIKDAELKKVTAEIRKAGANVIGNTFKISALIAKVDADKLYVNDGFADTFDYVKQCFGLEKASAYNLIRVGKEFIEEVNNGKSYETILTHAGKDFSISQVFKMLPLGIDKAKELTADEVITPEMSCRAIEKIVKENTEGTKARGKAKSEVEDEPETVDEPENDDAVLLIEWETIPDEIKEFFTHEYDLDGIASIEISGLE